MKASVITPEVIAEIQKRLTMAAVGPLASSIDGAEFWIGPKELIRSGAIDRAIGVRLLFGLSHVDEMSAGEKINFSDTFGFEPRGVVGLKTLCKGKNESRALGQCTLAVAQALKGAICFCGAMELPSTRSAARSGSRKRISMESATNRVFSGLPGTIRMIPYEAIKGQLSLAHYCDADFMKSWLENPYFHMAP